MFFWKQRVRYNLSTILERDLKQALKEHTRMLPHMGNRFKKLQSGSDDHASLRGVILKTNQRIWRTISKLFQKKFDMYNLQNIWTLFDID